MAAEHLLANVERYYSAKLTKHGATPAGVDWKDASSQALRFRRLLEIVEPGADRDINDYGCGYGALVSHLEDAGLQLRYCGFDISPAMIAKARELVSSPGCSFVESEAQLEPADCTVASGVFNVRLDRTVEEWESYVLNTLDRLHALSKRGFAFNMLTSYSDPDRMRPDLYYGDPAFFFDHCKRRFSRHVSLLHDYGLYEFTVLVRREPRA